MQEIQPAKDIDLICFKTFQVAAATCLQVGPMSLDWPVDPFARIDQSRPSLSPEVSNDEQQRGAYPASTRSRWKHNALQPPPQVLQRIAGWDGCGPFLGSMRLETSSPAPVPKPHSSRPAASPFQHRATSAIMRNLQV